MKQITFPAYPFKSQYSWWPGLCTHRGREDEKKTEERNRGWWIVYGSEKDRAYLLFDVAKQSLELFFELPPDS